MRQPLEFQVSRARMGRHRILQLLRGIQLIDSRSIFITRVHSSNVVLHIASGALETTNRAC